MFQGRFSVYTFNVMSKQNPKKASVSTSFIQTKKTKKRGSKMYSVKVNYNKNRVKSNGNASVYIQVIVDREVWLYNTKIEWPHHLITENGIKKRGNSDYEHRDYQLVIDQRLSKIKEIILNDRLGDQSLTINKLKDQFLNFDSKIDFLMYFKNKVSERYENKIITLRTFKNNMNSYVKLYDFKDEILFSEIKEELFQKFSSSLSIKGYKNNYIAGILKDVKKYMRLAKKDGIRFTDISSDIKSPKTSRTLVYLTEEELNRLYKTYLHPDLKPMLKSVLRQFLFSTETGIRISDISLVKWDNIDDDKILNFMPFKTRGLEKRVSIPLTTNAIKLIESDDHLFEKYSHPHINNHLKTIARYSNIKKNLTFHVARHTFATQFLARGGRVEVLQKLLGHTKIETTMVYVHVDITRVKKEMQLMEINRDL